MFPKSSFVMMLVAGLMLVAAMAINFFSSNEVNMYYLGLGLILVIFSSAMLMFKKK
ncbi:MAG: hypothetical protein ACR2GD_07475 [Pyrinomonadaceae bacterium]